MGVSNTRAIRIPLHQNRQSWAGYRFTMLWMSNVWVRCIFVSMGKRYLKLFLAFHQALIWQHGRQVWSPYGLYFGRKQWSRSVTWELSSRVDEIFRLQVLEISSDECDSVSRNFRKKGQPGEVHQNFWKFPFHWSLLTEVFAFSEISSKICGSPENFPVVSSS